MYWCFKNNTTPTKFTHLTNFPVKTCCCCSQFLKRPQSMSPQRQTAESEVKGSFTCPHVNPWQQPEINQWACVSKRGKFKAAHRFFLLFFLLQGWRAAARVLSSVTSELVEVELKQLERERDGGRINSNLTNRGNAWWEESRRCFVSVLFYVTSH